MIIIIDDDPNLGLQLEKLFRNAGLEAVAVPSGMEALSLLHVRAPDLIILDLVMPLLDGMTILRAIRRDHAYKSVPILVYTADFTLENEHAAIDAGAQGFIIKGTVGMGTLLARVKELLAIPRPPPPDDDLLPPP